MMAKAPPSIRGKLTRIIMLTSTAAVLITASGFVGSGLVNFRRRINTDLSAMAQSVAATSVAPLMAGDRRTAGEVLRALRKKPSAVAAAIYTPQGEPFALYERNPSFSIPPTTTPDGIYDHGNRFEMFSGIQHDGQRIGTLYIAIDKRDRNLRLKEYAKITSGIVVLSLLAALALSWMLQGSFSRPIVELARVMSLVSRDKDYSLRAMHRNGREGDEISDLVSGFNCMLAGLEQRDQRLLEYQTELVSTVASRTRELTAANEELLLAKNAAERVAEVNAKLARESALILNSATDGIMGVDLDNRLTFLNPAGARMLGVTVSELEGKAIHEAVHHSYADGAPFPESECANTQALVHGDFVNGNDILWRKDGTYFPVEHSTTSMFDEDGRQLGAVVMFRDITERRAIERLKNEFVSTVSHELRTPLTSIRGALGLLGSGLLGPLEERGRRMLEIAVSNTDRLVRLINDILDLERMESGRVELARGAVEAADVMVQALEGVQAMADQGGVRLVIEPASGALWGDSDRIIQLLTNLLGNAIKFSPPQTTVTLSGVMRESDFLFCVADEGRGVPEEMLETIFERFIQVDGSDSRAKGGSGLGLAICQSIVHAHGGRIWAERNDPVGSRFFFTIALAVPSSIAAASEPFSPHRLSVLLVEDDLDLARVIGTALQSRGIRTFHAISGGEALQLCRQHEPSLIVLDLTLPDTDGFAVVRALRESPTLNRSSLLVYSAMDVGSADQSRLRLGPTEFLTKSRCSPAEFEAHVVRMLDAVASEPLVV